MQREQQTQKVLMMLNNSDLKKEMDKLENKFINKIMVYQGFIQTLSKRLDILKALVLKLHLENQCKISFLSFYVRSQFRTRVIRIPPHPWNSNFTTLHKVWGPGAGINFFPMHKCGIIMLF